MINVRPRFQDDLEYEDENHEELLEPSYIPGDGVEDPALGATVQDDLDAAELLCPDENDDSDEGAKQPKLIDVSDDLADNDPEYMPDDLFDDDIDNGGDKSDDGGSIVLLVVSM